MHYPRTICHIILIMCACFLTTSCGKKEGPATEFNISGVTDVVLEENGAKVIELKVEQISAEAEQVTLTLSNVPNGISPNFDRVTDKPPFTALLYLKDDSSAGGKYSVTLTGTSAKGVTHSYNFNITTFEKTCALKATGVYDGTTHCRDGDGEIFGSTLFWVDSSDKSKLYFNWGQTTVHCIVNCNKSQITIPLQYLTDHSIKGEGYLDENYSIIDFEFLETYSGGDTVSCTAYFIKQ